MSVRPRLPDGPVSDTNVSRLAHRDAVTFDLIEWAGRLYQGWQFTCPRCGWRCSPKKHRIGAARAGLEHQRECAALG